MTPVTSIVLNANMSTYPHNYFSNEFSLAPGPVSFISFPCINVTKVARTVHSSDEIFECQWLDPSGPCNHEFSRQSISDHLRQFHGIRGADTMRVRCYWHGCGKELNRGNLLRHVKETHLSISYPCDTCNRRFTRQYNLNQHQTTCPGLQQ